MTGISNSFDTFRDCLPVAAAQQLDGLFDNWSRDFNLEVSSPHADYVADLMKQERALEQLFCINTFLDQQFLATETAFTGLLGFVETCLETAFSPEGYEVKLRLDEAIPRLATSRTNLQLAAITTQLAGVQATRLSLEQQNDLSLRVQNSDLSDPPFVVSYTTDRNTFTSGQPIVFDITTTLAIEDIEVTIPRPDQPNPFFEEVPESAIETLAPNRRRVTVELPSDYPGSVFSIKFFMAATRLDTCTFFVKFDRQGGVAPPRGKFVKRPCPPPQ